jgi:S1-C subfamily serine protease
MLVILPLTLRATLTCAVEAQDCGHFSSALGSVDDYLGNEKPGQSHDVPELGIEVRNGTGGLGTGVRVRGARVIRVVPEGPAARAGLRNEQRSLGKEILTGAFIAGGLVFPPALFGALVLGESDIGDSHDTIIGVDSQRTRDVKELENAIKKSREGPIIYLSVLRAGHRSQMQVSLCTRSETSE